MLCYYSMVQKVCRCNLYYIYRLFIRINNITIMGTHIYLPVVSWPRCLVYIHCRRCNWQGLVSTSRIYAVLCNIRNPEYQKTTIILLIILLVITLMIMIILVTTIICEVSDQRWYASSLKLSERQASNYFISGKNRANISFKAIQKTAILRTAQRYWEKLCSKKKQCGPFSS